MTFTFFIQNLINALQWGSFYALIALGYSMVYSILMLFNFAHGDIFMVGAYIGLGVAMGFLALFGSGAAAILPGWMILVFTILISMMLTALVGIIVERIGYRPLREAPRASAAITGLMIGIILETTNILFLGGQRLKFPQLIQSTTYNIGGIYITNKKIMIVLVSIGLMLTLHQFVTHSKWGMAMRAMAFDYVVCHWIGFGRRGRHSLWFGLSGLRSLYGGHFWLESLCGSHIGGAWFHNGGLYCRVYAGIH